MSERRQMRSRVGNAVEGRESPLRHHGIPPRQPTTPPNLTRSVKAGRQPTPTPSLAKVTENRVTSQWSKGTTPPFPVHGHSSHAARPPSPVHGHSSHPASPNHSSRSLGIPNHATRSLGGLCRPMPAELHILDGGATGGTASRSSVDSTSSTPHTRTPPAPAPASGVSDKNSIKVCVRVRPFSHREESLDAQLCVQMPTESQVVIIDSSHKRHGYVIDRAFWSFSRSSPQYASQQTLMTELGLDLIENTLAGYNSCLFAYGQTGSGKTYSILGDESSPEHVGMMSRVFRELFNAIVAAKSDSATTFDCQISYMEIYNDQCADLLCPPNCKQRQKIEVRYNPKIGVIVQGLIQVPVFTAEEVFSALDFGSKARMVGSTNMNAQSSRSHSIFTLEVRKKISCAVGGDRLSRAKLNFVDLAGSERQKKSGATGVRLKEASMINQGLTTLAMVIHTLAEASQKKNAGKEFVPFRSSKLTFVLQESLSGNSKTVMIAAISPSAEHIEESLTTLRFTESVKQVRTNAKKNEHLNANKDLENELERLRRLVEEGGVQHREELAALESLQASYGHSMEDSLKKAHDLNEQRRRAMESLGLSASHLDEGSASTLPRLVNVSGDPSLSGCLAYFIAEGEPTTFGSDEANKVPLKGLGITRHMLVLENRNNTAVKLIPLEGRIIVNGAPVRGEKLLKHGDRLILGFLMCLHLVVPQAAQDVEADALRGANALEHALGEVFPGDSEEYQKCLTYVQQLEGQVGHTRAQVFLQQFRNLYGLVEEANTISQEVRPIDRFIFVIEVMLEGVFSAQDETLPTCVVKLKKGETGAERWRNTVKRKILDANSAKLQGLAFDIKLKHSSAKVLEGLNISTAEPFQTVMLLTRNAFDFRLERLREIYFTFSHRGPEAVDFSQPGSDPWQDVSANEAAAWSQESDQSAELRAKLSEREREFRERDTQRQRRILDLESRERELRELDAQRQRKILDLESQVARERFEREREQSERDRLLAEQRAELDRERDAQVQDLEALNSSQIRALEMQTETRVREYKMQMQAIRTMVPDGSGGSAIADLSRKLRSAAEEGDQTEQVAIQLLSRMREMNGTWKSKSTSDLHIRPFRSTG